MIQRASNIICMSSEKSNFKVWRWPARSPDQKLCSDEVIFTKFKITLIKYNIKHHLGEKSS